MRSAGKRASLLLSAVYGLSAILCAQEPCKPPTPDLGPPRLNIFSPQQEQDLGDILAQELKYLRVTDDRAVTGYLTGIGDRLAQHLPPTQFRFHYFLVDSASPDAFSVAGGRIYVSRGMVALLRGPDEIAAILAHEMGHIVTHQSAINISFLLQQVLGVTQVTDRLDIQKKLDGLATNWRHNPAAFRQVAHRSTEGQLQADQVGLYALTAAGYSPEVCPELFQRTASTSGKTGGWLSDLLHTTTPDQLRLRQLLKAVEAMPAACIAQRLSADSGDFQKWKTEVFDFNRWSKRNANLHGVLAEVKLDPLALGEIQYIRFSPDGKFLLVDKDQSLYIFTHNPLAFLFRIHAPDAVRPRFTMDSKSVAFTTSGSRVEVWDLASQTRLRIDDPQIDSPCGAQMLSPDARTLACLRYDGNLNLIELSSGALLLEKKLFSEAPHGLLPVFIFGAHMDFSPDGHYFVACGQSGTVALDLITRKEVRLPGKLNDGLAKTLFFLANDRLLGWPSHETPVPSLDYSLTVYDNLSGRPMPALPTFALPNQRSEVSPVVLYEFPSAKTIAKIRVGWTPSLAVPTRGDYLLVGPLGKHALGIMDLKSKKIERVIDQHALDVYDQIYAHEILGGDLGLYDIRTGKLQTRAALPPPEDADRYLGATASPGLKWLATSAGAVWDLNNGKMIFHVRRFQGGGFGGEESFYADFPVYRDTPRTLVRMDMAQGNLTPGPKIEDRYATQHGLYLLVQKPQGPSGGALHPCHWSYRDFSFRECDATYEVHDVRARLVLWSRHFPKEVPEFIVEPERGRVILRWAISDAAVQDEIKHYPQLADAGAAARKQPSGAFIEILNLSDGAVLHATVLENGWGTKILTAGERLIVSHPGYMEVFSLAGGRKEGEIPGWPDVVSLTGELLSVRDDASNELEIYDLQSREKLDSYTFPADVNFDQFSDDAKRLLVLTSDQTAYLLATPE
jgi:hypothetical protein